MVINDNETLNATAYGLVTLPRFNAFDFHSAFAKASFDIDMVDLDMCSLAVTGSAEA